MEECKSYIRKLSKLIFLFSAIGTFFFCIGYLTDKTYAFLIFVPVLIMYLLSAWCLLGIIIFGITLMSIKPPQPITKLYNPLKAFWDRL